MKRMIQAACLFLLLAGGAQAQTGPGGGAAMPRPGDVTQQEVPENVGVEEKLGDQVPRDLTFVNEAGQPVTLAQFFDGERPVILNFVYHDCPMLCSLILDGLTDAMKEMAWTPGQEFEVLTVSFSPTETPELAAKQKALYLEKLGNPAAAEGWHFLTGNEANIAALAQATGFEFEWVPTSQEYAHNAVLILLGGDGMIARYLYGIAYRPFDLRAGLLEASEGKISASLGDRLLMYCFRYDHATRSYTPYIQNIMKLGGLLTLLIVGSVLTLLWRHERRRQRAAEAAA